jgi:hypothetical protein
MYQHVSKDFFILLLDKLARARYFHWLVKSGFAPCNSLQVFKEDHCNQNLSNYKAS